MYSHYVFPEKAIRSPTSTVQKKMAARGDKNVVVGDFFFRRIVGKDWRSGKEKLVEVMYVCKAVNFCTQAANTFNK